MPPIASAASRRGQPRFAGANAGLPVVLSAAYNETSAPADGRPRLQGEDTDPGRRTAALSRDLAGAAALAAFQGELDPPVPRALTQRYNGRRAPRLGLFSPIAHNALPDRNLPDGSANNQRLELYTAAMAEVAKANNVTFVDLFHP